MIHVFLTSEKAWQRNDANSFFTYLKGACTFLTCLD